MKLLIALFLTAVLLTGCLCAVSAEENKGENETMNNDMNDSIQEAIRSETNPDLKPDNSIPLYYMASSPNPGTIEKIDYTTKDYYGDGAEITKHAFVYLPWGYSAEQKYDVLILCHGIGGSEYEWGMTDDKSNVRKIMDKLAERGEIRPFIVVTPNGRSCKDFANTNGDFNSFYCFGQELRNDLIPWLDSHYSTYGTREHRFMAGLSMGGMQTINIGMCECLDLFSAFGAFSAAPTSYPAATVAAKLEAFPDLPIRYFYNICGVHDNIAYASASAAAKKICDKTGRLDETNFCWQDVSGIHDFNVWYLGFYNFARIIGNLPE